MSDPTRLEQFIGLQVENMKLMSQQLADMQAQMVNLAGMQATAAASSSETSNVQNSNLSDYRNVNGSSSNVPWPKPLQVDNGDLWENFQLFKNNWEIYLKATGMDKWNPEREIQKVNILLTIIGDSAKLKFNNFGLVEADKVSCTEVLNKVGEKLLAKMHPMYERWLFHTCNQLPNETFDDYLIRLNKIIDKCQFEKISTNDIKNTMLRDRIAFGVRDQELKKKFLREDPEKLALDDVINACKVNEITEDRFKNMHQEDKTVNKLVKVDKKQQACKFCNKAHPFKKDACSAFKHTCTVCNKKGHLEVCCYKKQKAKSKKVKEVSKFDEDVAEEDHDDYTIYKITDTSNLGGKVQAELQLKFGDIWKTVQCVLDTGADVCVIGYDYLCKRMQDITVKLDKSVNKLKSFSGSDIEVVGEIKLPCLHKNKRYAISFQVVNVNHGPLLSANACSKLGLVKYCNQIKNNSSNSLVEEEAKKIIDEYQDVFEGYGSLPGEVKLEVDVTVKPVIQPARRIPVCLRKQLKEELEKLVKDGIIVKEESHTDWVSNMLIVKKSDKFRICIDPIPLNKALRRPNFQFTTIDEILPELGRAKVFSTLDAKKGFWQLKLAETSSKLTCFWTPFGRYRWVRLPFGLAPSPEIFQMRMQELTQNLKGVEIMADDILIYGSGDSVEEARRDHNANLRKLLEQFRRFNCKLNKSKLELCKNSVKFYGFILTDEGLKPDNSKVDMIKNMPVPKDKLELQRFLGLCNYLGRFLKNLSKESERLRYLSLKKNRMGLV